MGEVWKRLIYSGWRLVRGLGTGIKYSWKNIYYEKKVKVTQSFPILCDPMDYTVRGILQARILEWVAFPFSRGFSQFRNRTGLSSICRRFVYQLSYSVQFSSVTKLCPTLCDPMNCSRPGLPVHHQFMSITSHV